MPGAYAHITAVNVVQKQMERQEGFPREALPIIFDWLKYCELGAVSPDYPYLDIAHARRASAWADAMHLTRSGDRIKRGIEVLSKMPSSDARDKALSWLFGFTAHVIMDVTVHPVVGLKVGPYEQNKREHRICEMNQDTYIYNQRLNLGVHYSDHLKSGICKCSDPLNEDKIDTDVFDVWVEMFQAADMSLYVENNPDIHAWHDCFEDMVRHIAGGPFIALARHVAPGAVNGCYYPEFEELDRQYIDNLKVPSGQMMSYDEVFDKGCANVAQGWAVVASDVLNGSKHADRFLKNWNLDTGEDENGIRTFWSRA